MKHLLATLLLGACTIAARAQNFDEIPTLAGSAIDRVNDRFIVRDASVAAADGALRRVTIGDLVNVPGLFSNVPDGTFSIAKTSGLQAALDAKAATSHTHAAADISSGTVATARLGSGTASASTFLRGDQTWASLAVDNNSVSSAIATNPENIIEALDLKRAQGMRKALIGSASNTEKFGVIAMGDSFSIGLAGGADYCAQVVGSYRCGGVTGVTDAGAAINISSATHNGSVVTITTASAHGWPTGSVGSATIAGITGSTGTNPNGTFTITVTGSTTYTYALAGAAGTYGGSATSVFNGAATVSGDYAKSPDGSYYAVAAGGTMTVGHTQTGSQGPASRVYYTLFPGAGTVQLQVSIAGGTWTNVGSPINTATITDVLVGSQALSTLSHQVRSRMLVTVGTVYGWLGQGMDDPGITYIGFGTSGQDAGQTLSIAEGVWKGMVAGYTPSGGGLIIATSWADPAITYATGAYPVGTFSWAEGGPWDTMRTWARTASANSDWLIIGPHQVDTGLTESANSTLDPIFASLGVANITNDRIKTGHDASKAWAERHGEQFVSCWELFPDYLTSYDQGLRDGTSRSVSSATHSGGVVTLTFAAAHGWAIGGRGGIRVSGITGSSGTNPNGRFYATATTSTQMTYPLTGAAGTYAGTITAILEDGVHVSAIGRELKRQHVAREAYSRIFGFGSHHGGLKIGDQWIRPLEVRPTNAGPTLSAQNNAGSVPVPGAFVAGFIGAQMATNPQNELFGMLSPSTNVAQFGRYQGGNAWNPAHDIRGANFCPTTTNGGQLGDVGQRWQCLYTGGVTGGFRTATSGFTVGKTDRFIHVTSGTFNITLPLAYDTGTGNVDANTWAGAGREIIIRNNGAGTVTVLTTSSQKIDNVTSMTVAPGATLRLMSCGPLNIAAADYGNWITF